MGNNIFSYSFNNSISAKSKLNKHSEIRNVFRHNFSPTKIIGNRTYLYSILKPKTDVDFFLKEIEYSNNNKSLPSLKRGCTNEEYIEHAKRFKELSEKNSNFNYDVNTYYHLLLCHTITETFIGQHKEQIIIDLFNNNGYKAEKVDSFLDAKYGIDIKLSNDNFSCFLQIKPVSFFISEYPDTVNDRNLLTKKRENCLSETNLDTKYLIYDIEKKNNQIVWLLNKENGIIHNFENLFDTSNSNLTFKKEILNNNKTVI